MSYDVEVYSVATPALPALPAGRSWQIAVEGPFTVEPEDIPGQVRETLPGLSVLTRFHLEGDAPDSALRSLRSIARALARTVRGVVVDQQQGTVETPRGVRRLTPGPGPHGGSGGLLQLSWFVESPDALIRAIPGQLLDLFQRTVPEFLPRRYGLFEPPQFTLETQGLAHLRQFLTDHSRDMPVWYCHKPCRHVFVSIPDRVGATPRGFRCGRLTLDADGVVATDHGWRVELMRLWVSVADLVQPFYAEIRLGDCPTRSWWWNGIPSRTPSAVLLGGPYEGAWPAFQQLARLSPGGLRYAERFVSGDEASVQPQLPEPPSSMAQPADRLIEVDPSTGGLLSVIQYNEIRYPEVWPFEGPRDS
jgi:hypothetical protein